MTRVYLIYDLECDSLYAWTESEKMAKLFMLMRKKSRFKMKSKKLKLKTQVDEVLYGKFRNDNRDKLICVSYLGQERKGAEYIEFPVTQYEDFKIGEYCDNLYDDMQNLSRKLCMIPFSDEVRDAIEFLAFYASKNEHISFDTFKIFMELFGDTVL